jgi:hypothetical protein
LGSDVSVTSIDNPQTEGKVFGAFILASTEYERRYLPITSEEEGIEEVNKDSDSKFPNHTPQTYDLLGRRITDGNQRTFTIQQGRNISVQK